MPNCDLRDFLCLFVSVCRRESEILMFCIQQKAVENV